MTTELLQEQERQHQVQQQQQERERQVASQATKQEQAPPPPLHERRPPVVVPELPTVPRRGEMPSPKVPPKKEVAPSPPLHERPQTPKLPEPTKPTKAPEVKIPKGAKVTSRTAEGRPEYYEQKGKRYYAAGSTMHKMGFRTRDEYRKAQQLGASHGAHPGTLVPKDSIIVTWHGEQYRFTPADLRKKSQVGLSALRRDKFKVVMIATNELGHTREVLISAREAKLLGGLTGLAQFRRAIKLGLLPRGSKYAPGKVKEEWGFVSPKEGEKREVLLTREARFFREHVKLPDGSWLKKEDLAAVKKESIPLYNILVKKGFTAYIREVDRINAEVKEFKKAHVIIGDQAMPIKEWNALPSHLQLAALRQKDLGAIGTTIDKAIAQLKPYSKQVGHPEHLRTVYDMPEIVKAVKDGKLNIKHPNIVWGGKEFQAIIKEVEHNQAIIKAVKGVDNNLPLALTRKIATVDDLLAVGFSKKDVGKAVETVKTAKDTDISVAGDRVWVDTSTGKMYTNEEREGFKKTAPYKLNTLVLTPQSGKRAMIGLASFVLPPARAALPEYTIKDISAIEWGLAGVNTALIATAFAPGAILGSIIGRAVITGISTTGAGLIGYSTAKHWNKLTPLQKGIGVGATVLYSLPMLFTVARGIKITTAKPIPTVKGEVPTWRGVAIANHPIIGRSGGRFVIGARNITLPEARLILQGYKPEMMLETKVFVNHSALRKAGLSQTQIDYLATSLKSRNLFAGKKSPYMAKEALLNPTQRLTANEVRVLLKIINKYNKKVKKVDMLYGSATIKPQLAPELRNWRAVHDWDISTTMSLEETKLFTKEILRELQKAFGKRKYRISPKSPTLIEKRIGNKWEHIADIHSHEKVVSMGSEEIPKSKLDVTGDYSYGRMVAEPAVTVKYPGIGKFDIMALSESGVRKADTILRVRQVKAGVAFRPPERGIASPGVPKDAADFYVILRTFKGEKIADKWLEAWAKAMGYTTKELPKALPRIRVAMLEVANNTPSNLIGYRFYPNQVKAPPSASPTIAISVPNSLAASVSGSLARQISSPISPYSVSPNVRASLSASLASVTPLSSKAVISPSLSPKLPTIAPSPKAVSLPVSLHPSLAPSPKPVTAPSPAKATISPAKAPSPPVQKLSPTIKPSPTVKPSPKPSPSPQPSPKPSPAPVPPVSEPPKPKIIPLPSGTSDKEKREHIRKAGGAVAWNMGKLGRKNPQDIWHVRMPDGEHIILRGAPPKGAKILADGPGSAYKTTQAIGGPLRRAIIQHHGAVRATITPAGTAKGAQVRFSPTGPRSIKRGRQYFTPMGSGVAISRRPLGRRHKR